jgi:drug/metabolite transporter (DMT)-like permease
MSEQNWLLIGLILAGELLYGLVIAVLTRLVARHNLPGQTYWLVVTGVVGVVAIAGAQIGWENVAFLVAAFAVAGLVMGVEYYSRLLDEHKAMQAVLKETLK